VLAADAPELLALARQLLALAELAQQSPGRQLALRRPAAQALRQPSSFRLKRQF
jgi:hypothetical protein